MMLQKQTKRRIRMEKIRRCRTELAKRTGTVRVTDAPSKIKMV